MGGRHESREEVFPRTAPVGEDHLPRLQLDRVQEVLSAVERRDWEGLKPLLHPYLHWVTRDGEVLRGRQKVMARLLDDPPSSPPSSVELRDGQVYRWTEAGATGAIPL